MRTLRVEKVMEAPRHPPDPISIDAISVDGLRRLWPNVGLHAAGGWRPEELRVILREWLDAPLEFTDDDETRPAAVQSRRAILLSQRPALQSLRRMKEEAKVDMYREDGAIPREVAAVLYFTTIVVAQVTCNSQITALGTDGILKGARWALRLSWLDDDLAALLRGAEAI